MIKTFLRQYAVLTKRLVRKPSFVAILLLVPMIVGATYLAASGGGSGVVTVALAVQDENDPIAREITDKLLSERSLINFVYCPTPGQAEDMVAGSDADAAWIFEGDLAKKIQKFTNHTHPNNAFVTVVQREDTVLLKISHEKLNSALYPYLSYELYWGFVGRVDGTEGLAPRRAREIYGAVNALGDELFDFVYSDGSTDTPSDGGYLTSPLRGMLAITVLFGGLAAAMYHKQDEGCGLFDRLPGGGRLGLAAVYHLTAVALLGAAVYAALLVSGMSSRGALEPMVLALYCLCTAGFCLCMRLLLPTLRLLSAAAPLLVAATAVLCPVFFASPDLPALQYLLPTYHYLRACANPIAGINMLIYTAVLFLLAFLLDKLHSKQLR